jgi:hypothetical protein
MWAAQKSPRSSKPANRSGGYPAPLARERPGRTDSREIHIGQVFLLQRRFSRSSAVFRMVAGITTHQQPSPTLEDQMYSLAADPATALLLAGLRHREALQRAADHRTARAVAPVNHPSTATTVSRSASSETNRRPRHGRLRQAFGSSAAAS